MTCKSIVPMTHEMAVEISRWDFGEGYRFYNIEEDPEVIESFLNGHYYAVLEDKEIFGFFCDGEEATLDVGYDFLPDCIDIGCALRPDMASKGFGVSFLNLIMNFYMDQHPKYFRLSVVDFNQRAIKCYKKVGFQDEKLVHLFDGHEWLLFHVMIKQVQP